MSVLWTPEEVYRRAAYRSEADLEASIIKVQTDLFGANRIYLDVKKKIGAKGGIKNIPDGYLVDLSSSHPRLYVVENELAAHDPLRHIAVQILQFSLSFESEQHRVKSVLLQSLSDQTEAKKRCEDYSAKHGYRNLDHLLEYLVYEAPFAALVVIDELPDNLENVLAKKFNFGVEVLELARYQSQHGDYVYRFDPFLADLDADTAQPPAALGETPSTPTPTEVDTVVVPAREDGFQEVFVGEDRWYAVRLHGAMRPQIRYAAVYRVAPIQAITHIAAVKSVEPWRDTGKYVINFSEPAKEFGPVEVAKGGRVKALQSLRYTTRERLLGAKTLDDVW